MNLKQLKYVLVLSQEGSFSRAADFLNISQPSLSQYIKKIEKQLGTDLFVRSNSEVRLTDAGQVYLEAGKKILSLEHQMENELADIASYKSGTISVGISPYRSAHMIPGVLSEFNKLYPGIKLLIKEKIGKDLLDSAEHGEFDICIIALPVDEEVFNYEIIQKEEVVISVHRDSELFLKLRANAETMKSRQFPAIDIGLVDGEDFAVLNESMIMRSVTDRLLKKYAIKINEKIELGSNDALLSIVKSGVCASFVPSGLTDSFSNPIAYFSIRQDFDFRNIAVIWRKDHHQSKPILDLIDIFKNINKCI